MGPWLVKPMLCAIKNVENAYKIMCGGIEWGACVTNRCSDSFLAVGRCSGFILKHWMMKSCASELKWSGIGGSSPFMTLKKNANYTHRQTKQPSSSLSYLWYSICNGSPKFDNLCFSQQDLLSRSNEQGKISKQQNLNTVSSVRTW